MHAADPKALCDEYFSLRDEARSSGQHRNVSPAPSHLTHESSVRPAQAMDAANLSGLLADAAALRRWLLSLSEDLARQEWAIRELAAAASELPAGAEDETSHDAAPALQRDSLYATFFGKFALYRGSSPVALGHNRAVLELCRYLVACAGQRVPRDVLLDLLWPDVPVDLALHRLHVAVSALRGLLGETRKDPLIQLDDQCYSVPALSVTTDCELFEQAYHRGKICLSHGDAPGAAAAFRGALELYQGDYLADNLYAEWTFVRRAHFVERRLSALTFLCEHAASQHDLSAVIDYATQILDIDNLRERSHRYLMRAYYAMGQRACALRQYKSCAEILQKELGAPPSRQTQELFEAISQDLPLPDETPMFRS
jgi:LuxR family transcriptional regulator, maltose regulon positive regulatory protein